MPEDTELGEAKTNLLNLEEFRDRGYLQEVNRQFLHRLGLALSFIVCQETGKVQDVVIQDYRDSEDGMVFLEIDAEAAASVQSELREKDQVRYERHGWQVQPLGSGPEFADQ